jgi:hypothetical protein
MNSADRITSCFNATVQSVPQERYCSFRSNPYPGEQP